MGFDIVQPEMMALGVGVGDAWTADALHLVEQGAIGQHRPPQRRPVLSAAAGDHIVDGGEREALVVEVTMAHGGPDRFFARRPSAMASEALNWQVVDFI